MRAARDNETVEDAIIDWGDVQKIETFSFSSHICTFAFEHAK